jgi:hypothetical protein
MCSLVCQVRSCLLVECTRALLEKGREPAEVKAVGELRGFHAHHQAHLVQRCCEFDIGASSRVPFYGPEEPPRSHIGTANEPCACCPQSEPDRGFTGEVRALSGILERASCIMVTTQVSIEVCTQFDR